MNVSNNIDSLLNAATYEGVRVLLNQPIAPVTLTYAASATPDCNDGAYRSITLTGDLTLNAPSNGIDGLKWKGRLTASGGSRVVTVHSAIKVPSESAFAGTQTIASGATWIIQMEYNGTTWMLQSLIGGWV